MAEVNEAMTIALEAFRQVMEKEAGCRVLHIGGTNERALKAAVYSYVAIAYPQAIAALKELLGDWADDDTMDHMPGVKVARAALAQLSPA